MKAQLPLDELMRNGLKNADQLKLLKSISARRLWQQYLKNLLASSFNNTSTLFGVKMLRSTAKPAVADSGPASPGGMAGCFLSNKKKKGRKQRKKKKKVLKHKLLKGCQQGQNVTV